MNIKLVSNFKFTVTSIHYAPDGELRIELSSEAGGGGSLYQYKAVRRLPILEPGKKAV